MGEPATPERFATFGPTFDGVLLLPAASHLAPGAVDTTSHGRIQVRRRGWTTDIVE